MPPFQYANDQSIPRNFESNFFDQKPLRSFYFIAGTLMMVLDLSFIGFVLIRYRYQIPTGVTLPLLGAAMGMVSFWSRAYSIWQRFYEIYSVAKLSPSFLGTPLDTALRNAGALMGAALYFLFVVTAMVLVALATASHAR